MRLFDNITAFRPGRACAAGLLLCAGLVVVAAGGALAQTGGSPTLQAVRGRGQLLCGVAGTVAGLSLPDGQGVMRGIDADGCRAIAAAALGDAGRVKFVPTTTQNRFTALQSGELDVLVRGTTWTLAREASQGLLFTGVNWYDGTGFLVKLAAGVNHARELDGATVCIQPGTSTELAIADYFRQNQMHFSPVLIQDMAQVQSAFLAGRCDAYATDSSGLASFRISQAAHAADFRLLPDIISKEPLGPMVRKGDDKWFDLVRWTQFAQVTAEELGVTSANVDEMAKSDDPNIRRLLGSEGALGQALGVDDRWAYTVIRQVGNFGEMWDRDVAPLGVPRGLNNLWSKGGLQYAPPLR